ncbi:MAG: FAD-binding protein [bacterium]|nr:FAD-binding protein [bacterium]
MASDLSRFLSDLEGLLGKKGLLTDSAARRVYSLDSSHLVLGQPVAVALPQTAEQISNIITLCNRANVPIVCRGSGTGLSGGAVPSEGALVLGLSRMTQAGGTVNQKSDFQLNFDPILPPPTDPTMNVEAGVLNEEITHLASSQGLHFAPDPSSQAAATLGGNIAENAGGPHCLRFGVTLQHLRNLNWIDHQGNKQITGRGLPVERGLDLTSLLCGSEGTLGVVTSAQVKLTPNPEFTITLLVFFPDLNDATESVVALLGAGLQPVAVEMVDQTMLLAVEEAFQFGFRTDVEGAMIAEFTGREFEVKNDVAKAVHLFEGKGANEIRQAEDEKDRLELWKCRKKAFGAVGRLAPRYVTMDVVVPLGCLPDLVRQIQVIKKRHGVQVATAFHAGDGNLHPGVHYDDRKPDQTEAAHRAADEIIQTALEMDGSCTGEHGVGIEKTHAISWQLSAPAAHLNLKIKKCFDPNARFNPGKMLPSKDAKFPNRKPVPREVVFRWKSLSVTAPANTLLAEIQDEALSHGLCLAVGAHAKARDNTLGFGSAGTVGDLLKHLVPGPSVLARGHARDYLLELWAQNSQNVVFHTGAPVFKNVAGYGLSQALCGSGNNFAEPLAATFQLKPVAESVLIMEFQFNATSDNWSQSLQNLVQELPRDDVASPSIILDLTLGQVFLIVAGRQHVLGLPALAARTKKILPEFNLMDEQILKYPQLRDFLVSSGLPSWTRSSNQWTLWSHPGNKTASFLPPTNSPRLIWQAIPAGWWTCETPSQPGPQSGDWFADSFFSDGDFTSPPPPAPGVSQPLLARLKNAFDSLNQQDFATNEGTKEDTL